jgi:predicted RNase H-like HicB family nuclease
MSATRPISAVAEWDGYSWVATLPDLPGAVTQAKRLDVLPGRLAEVARLMTGDPIDAGQISLETRVADRRLDRVAREITQLEDELGRVSEALASRRRQLVTDLHDRGHTLRDIGVIVRLSHQRVAQLLAESTNHPRSA